MSRDFLVNECNAFLERLVAIGDIQAIEDAFGTRDIAVDLSNYTTSELQVIYDEYIQ